MSSVDLNWREGNGSGTYDGSGARWMHNLKDPNSGEVVGHIAFDTQPVKSDHLRAIYCLLCTVTEKYGQWQLTCLGLMPVDEPRNEFTRIGLVFIRDTNWFGALDWGLWDDPLSVGSKAESHNDMFRTLQIV